MSVQEIEEAVIRLTPEDLAQFTAWFEEYQAQAWDEQIARDARAGQFDQLIQRAREQVEAGGCQPDRFFSREQIERLAVLMDRWREARDHGVALAPQEQAELEQLVEAELVLATKRAAAMADALGV